VGFAGLAKWLVLGVGAWMFVGSVSRVVGSTRCGR
jgi:hypothetical protein